MIGGNWCVPSEQLRRRNKKSNWQHYNAYLAVGGLHSMAEINPKPELVRYRNKTKQTS